MQSEQYRFFVLTCRDPKTDFRLPLVDALRRHYETYYIWLRRHPIVSGPGPGDVPAPMSLLDLLRFMRRSRRNDRTNVYFNSTNTYFPTTITGLRALAAPGVWCFDMHDDLRYHNTGLTRWRESQVIALQRRMSHLTVHAAPTLQELFPDSIQLGNASNILPVPAACSDKNDVLIIASFDERFDFDFVDELARACPGLNFHLHGWTRPGDITTHTQIVDLAARRANIQYHGGYTMADLPCILERYRISVAPYRTGTDLTRYIDPLRFYHCLNAGLEVVSTDIPQARFMAKHLHVVSDATACADALSAIQAGELAKQPAYTPITWEQRADRLVEIIRARPRPRDKARQQED
jgi:hypothetical protein